MRDKKGRFMKGNTPWTKGKVFPELSIRNIGNKYNFGKKRCTATKLKISLALTGRKGKPHTEEWKKRMSILNTGVPKKGGKFIRNGYVYILSNNHPFKDKQNYVREHRLVMEKHIGRYLTPEERVHHINEKTSDNRIDNLMIFANEREHQRFHNHS